MEYLAQEQLNLLANSFNLEHLEFTPDYPISLTLNNEYQISIEYNKTSEILVIFKMPFMQYDNDKLVFLLQHSSYLERPAFDFSVAYGKEHLLLIANLGSALNCTAHMIEQSILSLINVYQNIPVNTTKN